jgi:hypothetical protein
MSGQRWRAWLRRGAVIVVSVVLTVAAGVAANQVIINGKLSWPGLVVALVSTALLLGLRRQSPPSRRREEAERETKLPLRTYCVLDEVSGWLPRVSALTDPIALGVHPATPITERDVSSGWSAGKAGLPARVPVYVPRDLDARLDAALARSGLVVLYGDSTAGKSLAAYEAMRRLPGDPFVLIPTGYHGPGVVPA